MICHIDRPTGFWKVVVTINGVETIFSEPLVRTAEVELTPAMSYKVEVTGYWLSKARKYNTYSKIDELEGVVDGCRIVITTKSPRHFYALLLFYFISLLPGFFIEKYVRSMTHNIFSLCYVLFFCGTLLFHIFHYRNRAFTVDTLPP